MTWLITGAKELLLTTTTTLSPKTSPYHNWRGLQLDIGRNNSSEAIKQFSQNLFCFQELFSGVNEDENFGADLILFPVDYLKSKIVPKTNNLLTHQTDPGEFIQLLRCWLYMGCWVVNLNRRNWWSTAEPKMSEGAPLRLNKYMSKTKFEGIISSLHYTNKKYV